MIQARQDGDYEIFLLELGTGMRLGDILALQWNDLSFATGELRISKSATFIKGEFQTMEPKTRHSVCTVVLSDPLLAVLERNEAKVNSRWMFRSLMKEDCYLTLNFVRRRMQQTRERIWCKKVRFYDLRHNFATMDLEHGMDVKTLSTIIGYISSATTLDIYGHFTVNLQLQATAKIDRQIGKTDTQMSPNE